MSWSDEQQFNKGRNNKTLFSNKLTLGRTGGGEGMGVDATPHKVFLSFFPEDKTSVPEVFSSCSFISRTDFETSLVMVSCFVHGIWRHK